jgi:hypothetical protein
VLLPLTFNKSYKKIKKKKKFFFYKKKMEEEQEEIEWESKLADNIRTFCMNAATGRGIVVDGTVVRTKNGLVMISGNENNYNGCTSTEIYDYANNSVRKGPDMKVARWEHASVTLPNGDITIFGGYNSKMNPKQLSSCEVFNVKSNSFSEIGNMINNRERPAAVLLPTGVVLLIGGANDFMYLSSCEFYDPLSKTFSRSKAQITIGRIGHTASLLPDGRVLVCGGSDGYANLLTEIYDPSADSFSAGPLLTVKRYYHAATTLEDGKILLTGGRPFGSSDCTEIYDPTTKSFTTGPDMVVARRCHFSALLPDGSVLIGGGWSSESDQKTEIYDPITNSFTTSCNLLQKRESASASNF